MRASGERAEAERIKAKIRELGRGSLTRAERDFIAYSVHGDAAGCASCYSPIVPDRFPPDEDLQRQELLDERI